MIFLDFIRGYGSIFKLFPREEKPVNFSIPKTSDEEALHQDWEQAGSDLYNAMRIVIEET